MPRKARTKSSTCIYHVMIRGINHQNLFEDDEDRTHFMGILKECKEISGFEMYAFCLMTNHVHLLLRETDEPLEVVFKRIGSRYAYWYNNKYQRIGHLFQDRFKSENVEDDAYFLTVLRYIIQNPMKAGMEKEPGKYRWSSFQAYAEGRGAITDIDYAVGVVGSRETLIGFLKEENTDQAMEDEEVSAHISDDEARRVMVETGACVSAADYQRLTLETQRKVIIALYRSGATPTQIVRMTGKAKASVYRIINNDEK